MARDFRTKGIPLIRLAGLKRSATSLFDGCNYLDLETVERRWSHFRVKYGDVLLSASASLGEVAIVDEASVGAIPYTGIICFRSKDPRVLPQFVEHLLTAPAFQRQIEAMGVGSVIRHFVPMHLRQMTVTVPPVKDQEAIAEVVRALDDKIGANERVANSCEVLARALVCRNGVPQTCPLGSMVSWSREQVAPEHVESAIVEHFSIPAFDSEKLPELTKPDAIKSNKFRVPAEAVLVSKLNPATPRIWRVKRSSRLSGLASTELLILVPSDGVSTADVWAVCSQPSFSECLAGMVTGTSNSHQRVAPVDVLAVDVADPRSLSAESRRQIELLLDRAHGARWESRTLLELRNALLPRLMSGEIRVRDAEMVVEEAL